jgi:hypothetical protein
MGFLVISESINQKSKEMVLVVKEGMWNYIFAPNNIQISNPLKMKNHERSLLVKMGADHPSFLLAIYRQNEKLNLEKK